MINQSTFKKDKKEQGFTMIEMLVSILIFTIAIGAIYQVMQIGTLQRNTINTRVDSVKGSRIALNYIRRDVINAGLSYHNIGGLVPDNYTNKTINATADADTEQDWLTSIVAGNDIGTTILNPTGKTDSIGFVYRDMRFNDSKSINFISTTVSGNDVVIKTATGDAANCKKYDLYLFETGTTQVVGIVTSVTDSSTFTLGFGTAVDPIGVNLSATGTGTAKSLLVGTGIKGSFKKINYITYSVSADGALVRKTFGNQTDQDAASQIDTRELIYGVKDFQIRYLLDDGTSSDDPSQGNNGRTNQQIMNRVIAVEVTLTVLQDDESKFQSSSPTVFKETISTRNLRYTIG